MKKVSINIEIQGGHGSAENVEIKGTESFATLTFRNPNLVNHTQEISMDISHLKDLAESLNEYLRYIKEYGDNFNPLANPSN